MKLEQYRAELDGLRFSEEDKDLMMDRLMIAQEGASAPHAHARLRRVPMLAVLLAALLLFTAGSFAVRMVSDWFAPRYGAAYHGIINELGALVGVSDTHDGITITADAIMGDRHKALIALTVSRDNGEPLTREMFEEEFGSISLDLNALRFGGSGSHSTRYADEVRGDNRFEMYHEITRERSLLNREITLCFTNQDGRKEDCPAEAHSWTLEFTVDYPDCTVDLKSGKTVETPMGEATIDTVELSPLGLYLSGHYEEAVTEQDVLDRMQEDGADSYYAKSNQPDPEYYIPVEIVVNKTDGTTRTVPVEGRGASWTDVRLTEFRCRPEFTAPISLDDIESISINGTVWAVTERSVWASLKNFCKNVI